MQIPKWLPAVCRSGTTRCCCVSAQSSRARAIGPYPPGFSKTGAGAHRETWEEAEAKVENSALYTVFSLPHISQIYVFYKADVTNGKYGVGTESLDTRLFSEPEIPWDELAFPVVTDTLKHYFADRQAGDVFPVHDEVVNFRRRIAKD